MKFLPVFSLAVASFLSCAEADTTFAIKNFQCTSPIKLYDLDYSCNGGSTCTFNDEIEVSASVTALDIFSTDDVAINYKVCVQVMSLKVYCTEAKEANTNLCAKLTSDSLTCGQTGTYSYNDSFTIPDVPEADSFWINMFTTKVVAEISDLTTCTVWIKNNNFESSSSSASVVSMSAMAGVALLAGAVYFVQRRRRIVTEGEDKAIPFVEMTDSRGSGAIV